LLEALLDDMFAGGFDGATGDGVTCLLVNERLQQNPAEQKRAEPTYSGFLIEVS